MEIAQPFITYLILIVLWLLSEVAIPGKLCLSLSLFVCLFVCLFVWLLYLPYTACDLELIYQIILPIYILSKGNNDLIKR